MVPCSHLVTNLLVHIRFYGLIPGSMRQAVPDCSGLDGLARRAGLDEGELNVCNVTPPR